MISKSGVRYVNNFLKFKLKRNQRGFNELFYNKNVNFNGNYNKSCLKNLQIENLSKKNGNFRYFSKNFTLNEEKNSISKDKLEEKLIKTSINNDKLTENEKETKSLKEKIKSKIPVEMHENLWTVPNILTMSRILATPFIAGFIVTGHSDYALGLFSFACMTDALDGFTARSFKWSSVLGTVLDPIADKFLMTTLTVAFLIDGTMPIALGSIIIGRDIFLFMGGLWYRYKTLPKPKTWGRFWDLSLPSAEVHPTSISKANTFFQMALIGFYMMYPYLHGIPSIEENLTYYEYFVATTTILSGLSYVFSKTAVRVLKNKH